MEFVSILHSPRRPTCSSFLLATQNDGDREIKNAISDFFPGHQGTLIDFLGVEVCSDHR